MLVAARAADPADLFDAGETALERSIDEVRARFGEGALVSGRVAPQPGD